KKMRVLVSSLAFAVLLSALSVSSASAATITDARLDQVARDVSGYPIRVLCETSFDTWRHDWDQDDNITESGTASGDPRHCVVSLSPPACSPLLAALDHGPSAAGTRWGALAILTLLHVALYQGKVEAGTIHGWRLEGATNCEALRLVP